MRVLTGQCKCREDFGVFSGGLHEVSIAAISLIDMAEKSRPVKTERSGPNR